MFTMSTAADCQIAGIFLRDHQATYALAAQINRPRPTSERTLDIGMAPDASKRLWYGIMRFTPVIIHRFQVLFGG